MALYSFTLALRSIALSEALEYRGYMAKVREACIKNSLLALFLFLFWIFITASWSLANIILGLIVSFLVALTVRLVFRIRWPEDIASLFFLMRLPIFLAVLARDVIKANIDLAYILLRPRLLIDPKIVRFRSTLRGDFQNTVLADTITVTPGTLTLDAQGDELLVHCLAPSHKKGLLTDRHSERLVLWLFKRRDRTYQGDG